MIKWTYVVHQPTDRDAILIQEGEFEGVVSAVTNVKFPIYKEDGTTMNLEEAENIPLTFDYDILYNKENKWHEESKGRFLDIIGNILFDIIEEGLDNDRISYNTEDRNDNTE
jgi:hypothetical protein